MNDNDGENSHRIRKKSLSRKCDITFGTSMGNLEAELIYKKFAFADPSKLKNDICRTCLLHPSDMILLTAKEYIGGASRLILDILKSLSKISENDRMPVGICTQCLENAKLAFCFKEQCQKADSVLTEYFEMIRTKNSSNITHQPEYVESEFMITNVNDIADLKKPREESIFGDEFNDSKNVVAFRSTSDDDENTCVDYFKAEVFDVEKIKKEEKAHNINTRHVYADRKHNPCAVCNKKVRNMQQHMKRHNGRTHTCEECGKSYPNRCDLRNHLKIHSADRPYKCDDCPKEFTQKYKLKQHMLGHEGKKAFMCELCGKGFNRRKELASHDRVHTGLRSSHCSICSSSFVGSYTLARHMRTHTGEKKYTCDTCSKSFAAKQALKVHLRLHTGEKPYTCPEEGCDRSFSTAYSLQIHRPVHTNVKPYSCNDCGKPFARVGDLRKHEATHIRKDLADAQPPAAKVEKHILCPHCGKSFVRKADLKRHILTHTQEKPFKCPECDRGFNQRFGLTQHMRCHTGVATFMCDLCGKGFMRKATLQKHKFVHSGIRNHKCEYCDKAFTIRAHLVRHQRVHTGERPFKCEICQKSFSGRSNYVVHLRSHTGEKPYQCQFCDKTCTTSTALKVHTRNHTGERPYVCPNCSIAFSRSDLRSLHMRHCCPETIAEPVITQEVSHGFYLQHRENVENFQQSLSIMPKTMSIQQSTSEIGLTKQTLPLHSIRLDDGVGNFIGSTLLSTEAHFTADHT